MSETTLPETGSDTSRVADENESESAPEETATRAEPIAPKEFAEMKAAGKPFSAPNVIGWILGAGILALVACNYVRIGELRKTRGTRNDSPISSATDSKLSSLSKQLVELQSSIAQLQSTSTQPEAAEQTDVLSRQLADLNKRLNQLQKSINGFHKEAPAEQSASSHLIVDLNDRLDQLQQSVDGLHEDKLKASEESGELSFAGKAIEMARQLEEAGEHERAGYYWRNAVEHASNDELLPVLGEYAKAFFASESQDVEARYAEAATLERLAELALVRVPVEKMVAAFELRDKCAQFRSELFAETDLEVDPDVENEPENEPEPIAKTVADSAKNLLDELEREVANYSGPSKDRSATEEECLILQLSGVAESTISQLWFLDRTGLDEAETKRLDAFPKRLADLVDRFNEKHDAPLVAEIQALASAKPNKSYSYAPHQRNVEFYTNQVALATAAVRHLRGTNAQTTVQKSIASIMEKVADEKRQQMNEYQKFVANCCKLANDSWDDTMNTGPSGFGRLPKNKGYKDEDDFIKRYVRDFARSVRLSELVSENDRRSIYAKDNWISQALQRSSGGPNYWDVKNEHKAFIVTAIYGFYRIDQSLLTPETARMFNDVFGKYYDKMDSTRKTWSVRWMVEEPKIRLEDF